MPTESAKELIELLTRQREHASSKETPDLPEKLVELLLNRPSLTPEEHASRLRRAFDQYQVKHKFTRGQLVKWKVGMKDKKLPADGEPAIVVEVLDPPLFDSAAEAGSAYFRQPLDIVLGVIDPDGDFAMFHFDSRRFEPWESDKKPA